jgi:hypothetical protein
LNLKTGCEGEGCNHIAQDRVQSHTLSSKVIKKKASSGLKCHVELMLTDVSEERIASIFRVEEKRRKSASEEPA